ncbi:phage tail tape measure protein [Rhodoplanes sp. TEM]|uniref:Phage tail tape measure protein n=1 Tax=Rhodoplanes tepidamans TaxID=200616 RepID=A0ABT5JCP0_RHOTP|nr:MULTISPECIES: phage tail tape measure protein [Rhodoplanes]MDC7787376.1 phage tail tape measure protein [Rhodoplanes tepidamans]MDC7984742.1 phage tail tape measure protein [Rhodoplanes sp. TEM]MDQ0358287.1 TP901 family phage tail tape measure protein [Rhodoplanes tepidamans]
MTTLDVALRLKLINDLKKGSADAAKDLAGIKTAAAGLNGTRGADKLKRDILDVSTASRQAGQNLGTVRREAQGLGTVRGPEKLKRDLLETASAARKAQSAVSGLHGAAQKVRDRAGAAGGRGRGGPVVVGGTADALAGIGTGYAGYRAARAAARTVVDQDKAWAEVRKKVTGTPDQLAALQGVLRKMAFRYGMEPAEAFQQAAAAGAAGIDIKELPEAVETGLMASKAWDTSARETMQTMAEMKSALGWSLQTLRDWGDKVNALADASAASERALIEAAKRSTAPGAAVGLDYDTVLGITAAQISGGMPEEVAARWMNTFGSKLAAAHVGTDKQQEALKKYLGLDPKQVSAGMEKNARGTILDVLGRFDKLKQQDKVAFGVQFFGQEWWDETARAAKVLPEITRMLEILGDKTKWSGSMQGNLAIQLGTIESHYQRVAAAAANAAEATDRMSGASKGFKDIANWLGELTQRYADYAQWVEKRNAGLDDRIKDGIRKREDAHIDDLAAKLSGAESGVAKGRPFARWERDRLRRELEDARMRRAEARLRDEALAEKPGVTVTDRDLRQQRGLDAYRRRYPTLQGQRSTGAGAVMAPAPNLGEIVPPTAGAKAQAAMQGVTQAIKTEGAKAEAEAQSVVERIKAIFQGLNFNVSPTITPRLGPGGVGGGGGGGGGGGDAKAPGKQSSRGGITVAGPVHFHGVQDVDGVRRAFARLGTNTGALFDTV